MTEAKFKDLVEKNGWEYSKEKHGKSGFRYEIKSEHIGQKFFAMFNDFRPEYEEKALKLLLKKAGLASTDS